MAIISSTLKFSNAARWCELGMQFLKFLSPSLRSTYNTQASNLIQATHTKCAFVPARKRSMGQGNIFSSVCQEFCPQGGGSASVHAGIPPPGSRPPRSRPPPEQAPPWEQTLLVHTPPGSRHPPPLCSACWEIRSTSGRYASYWNAIF